MQRILADFRGGNQNGRGLQREVDRDLLCPWRFLSRFRSRLAGGLQIDSLLRFGPADGIGVQSPTLLEKRFAIASVATFREASMHLAIVHCQYNRQKFSEQSRNSRRAAVLLVNGMRERSCCGPRIAI